MHKTFNLKEFVKEFGTEKQNESFLSGKGNLNKRTFTSIMNNAYRYYEKSDVSGKGKKRQISLYEKRKFILEKEDKRRSNGKWSNPYTLYLDLLIIKTIEKGIFHERDEPILYWCKFFGVINEQEYKLLKTAYNESSYNILVSELKKSSIIKDGEERIVRDFLIYYNKLKIQTLDSLVRFSKIHALEMTTFYNGILNVNNKSDKQNNYNMKISITKEIYENVKNIEKELKDKFNVNDMQINNHPYAKKVIAYKNERNKLVSEVKDESGNKLDLKFVYTTYQLYTDSVDDLLTSYFDNFKHLDFDFFLSESDEDEFWENNRVLFLENRKKYIEDSSKKNMKNFLKPKEVKKSLVELGGKPELKYPHLDDYKSNHEYFSLYFNSTYSDRMKALSNYFIDE